MTAYHLDQNDSLGILHLHASNANAMNDQVLQAISTGLQEAVEANLKGLVLTGYDRFFSAGLDLLAVSEFDREQMRRFIAEWEAAMIRLFEFPMPVIAAINGAATAGGCILAMACDYRIMAAESTVIGMNGIRLGISLPAAALEIARNEIPAAQLAYVLYSGRLFKADEALQRGLIHEVVPQENLLETALARLREFTGHASNPAAALKGSLRRNTLARIRENAEEMREKFLDVWFSPTAQRAIHEARNGLLAKR
ncbi:MAG: enoyl-CoA hydratase/isomerase family protein [bacterium]